MSAKIELYTLVKDAVEAIADVSYFGKFNNQFETEDREHALPYPCVLFEFTDIAWQPSMLIPFNAQGTQQQKTESLQFTLHIAYWDHRDENDKYLSLLDIVDKVYRALANIDSDSVNPLQRVSEGDDSNHTEPIVWRTTFATMLTEKGIEKAVSSVSPGVTINT